LYGQDLDSAQITLNLTGQNMDSADYLILGGGLAGGLAALALAERRPGARVVLVEQGARLGGNHTWSLHDSDLPDEARAWIEPLVAHRWSSHRVRFPDLDRHLAGGYASITSERFDRVVQERLRAAGFEVRCGARVVALGPGFVRLEGGRSVEAAVVLDARGIPADGGSAGSVLGPCGYQKFLGLEVELDADLAPEPPMLIDACVPQLDGFRFVYVLPLAPRRLLVEDTTYADDPGLDPVALRARLFDYLRARNLGVSRVVREEVGVLPLPLAAPARPAAASPVVIGYRGAWFHPLTGYSLPAAVQVALVIAAAPGPAEVPAALARAWVRHQRQARFCQWLSGLMFSAVSPGERWRLLARFYRLPEPTIARFYALRLTWLDRLRLLAGPPPRGLSLRPASSSTEAP
jgi:lycopene beta-cyclase